jgi:putative hydrolase of the HAD superfamily
MLAALEFTAFPDAAPALRELRAAGHGLVVVSNWDCSLPEWLRPAGLLDLVDAVVSSAVVGAAKPDPAPFRRALELSGAQPGDALHVGDSPENDLAGARAAGVRAVLVDRSGSQPAGIPAVRSLAELSSLV